MAVPPPNVDRSAAGDHEVFEDTDQELQDLVRLEVQWASSFASAVSGLGEALWWLCLNSSDFLFVESVEMNWKDWS